MCHGPYGQDLCNAVFSITGLLTVSSCVRLNRPEGRVTRLVRLSVCLSVPFCSKLDNDSAQITKIGANVHGSREAGASSQFKRLKVSVRVRVRVAQL